MPTGVLGIRDINPNMWPSGSERGGVFANMARSAAPTVRPNNDALEEGDYYYNTVDDTFYIHNGTSFVAMAAASSALGLNGAYSNGQTITRNGATLAITDDRTNATDCLSIAKSAAGSGDLIDLSYTAAATGAGIRATMTTAATAAQALVVVGQASVRVTNPLVAITENGTGAVPAFDVLGAAATTGALIRARASAAVAPVADTDGMVTIDTTGSANAAQGLLVYNNTAAHTGTLLRIYDNAATGAGTSLGIAYATTFTGDAINVTMTNAATAAQALVIVGQAAARITNALVSISEEGTGALPTVDIAANATTTGALLRLRRTGGAALPVADTDGMQTIDVTGTGNAAQGLLLYNNTAAHTGTLLRLYDAGATGAGTSLGIAYGTTFTGDAINVTMTNAGAGAQALVVVGHTAATSNVIEITANGTGAGNALAVIGGGTMSGDLVDIAATAAVTGDFLAITMTNAGNGADGITLTGSPTGRTGIMLSIADAETTGSGATISVTKSGAAAVGDVFNIDLTSTGAGPVFDINLSAAYTGIVFDIDGSTGIHTGNVIDFATTQAYTGIFQNVVMTNSGVGAQALVVVGQAGAATSSLCSITANGTGDAHHALDLVAGGALSATDGVLLDLSATAAIAGDFVLLTMTNAAAGADGIVLTGSPTGRTGTMLSIADAQTTGSGPTLSLTKSGALAVGDVIDITCSGTGAGAVFDIDLTTAYTGIVFDIDGSVGVHTGDIFNFNTTQAYAADVFDIDLTNCAAGVQLLVITASATARSANLIAYTGGAADTGDVINIALGAFTGSGNAITVTTGAAAWSGDAFDWTPNASSTTMRALDLNGAGTRTVNVIDVDCTGADTAAAISVVTAGVGASNVPAGVEVSGTGDLVAGGDLARFVSTGSPSSTSNLVAIEQSTGAGTAGAYALYVSATGTNVEGILVDDGDVVVDEDLTVSGNWLAGTPENITAGTGGAINVTELVTTINTDAGGDAYTLANGTVGQLKVICMIVDGGGNAVITPTTALGFTTWTGGDAGDSCILFYSSSGWVCVSNQGGALA